MLNMLRRVTSEGTSKFGGPSINFRKRQNKLNSLWGAVLTSLDDLVEIFH